MIFAAPLALAALAALPPLYFLFRLTPPAPRRQLFPPVRLLQNLTAAEQTPHRLPPWLLLLRLTLAAILILGFAGPTLHPQSTLPGNGPILLVIDNGWASAPIWPELSQTARDILAAAESQHRAVAILTTARPPSGAPPQIQGIFDAQTATQALDAIEPLPWPPDHLAARTLLATAPETTRLYLAGGITDGPGFQSFLATLHPAGIYAPAMLPPLLMPPARNAAGGITLHVSGTTSLAELLAEAANGKPIARVPINASGFAVLHLPPSIAAKIAKFTLYGPPAASTTVYPGNTLLSITAGLAAGSTDASSPFTGTLFFLRRALPAATTITTAGFDELISRKPDVIFLADTPLNPAQQRAAASYIAAGGILIRCAGPLTASTPDPLTASPLLGGDRRLGGTLSWAAPQHLAPFPDTSPFAGLAADPSVTVSQQLLADPAAIDPQTIWATLADGTPLVLGKTIGQGELINFLIAANASWSNLPLSGLYPQMLSRLTALGRGQSASPAHPLSLISEMDAYGNLSAPSITAEITPGASFTLSPNAPPGLYGSPENAIAINIAGHIPTITRAQLPKVSPYGATSATRPLGPDLITAATLLLMLDQLLSLALRGRFPCFALLVAAVFCLPVSAKAQSAALQPELGYLLTKNPATDQTSADGLSFLSQVISAHTSVQLGPPAGLTPGQDDLNFYPLIYWPLLPAAAPPSPAACAALTDYMSHGGLLVIDTQGGDSDAQGSGAGFAPGAGIAFAHSTACLNLPPLQPLTGADVLAHSFYIVPGFPGRFTGGPVLIAIQAARDADDVSPVIVGQNDWAGAWARDASGNPEQTPIPDGEYQRLIADRFGVNLAIYALTGSYKSDQNTAPAVLEKLGP